MKITVDRSLGDFLSQFNEPVELCDSSGQLLGLFLPEPKFLLKESDQCPYTEAELEEMRRTRGGRTLAEIWEPLGRDCGAEDAVN